jgi:hypothetical protein
VPDQPTSEQLTDTAERAWRWVLDQLRTDEHGPWMPRAVRDGAGAPAVPRMGSWWAREARP